MTKVLLITNKEDVTIDFVVKELKLQDIPFYRLNTEDICGTVSFVFDFERNIFLLYDSCRDEILDLLSFTAVYYRRPELPAYADCGLSEGEKVFLRTETYYLLEGLFKILRDKNWLNTVCAIRESENKIYQLLIARGIGLITPDSIITNQPEAFLHFVREKENDCIIKPIHNGRVLDSVAPQIIFTSRLSGSYTDKEIKFSANYLQQCINKQYDIRVTIVDDNVFAVSIDSQVHQETRTDWRKGQRILKHTPIVLPKDVKDKCRLLMEKLNLRYGAIDFILDEQGNYIFLEINPNGQWAWVENLTGLSISRAIVKALCK